MRGRSPAGEPGWAFVLIDHFPLQVAILLGEIAPDQAAGPVVLGGAPHERKAVVDCSPAAADRGVRPGQSLREAQAICPEAVFRPVDPDAVQALFDRLLIDLTGFSPAIEPVGLGRVIVDIGGLSGLYGAGDALAARLLGVVQSPKSKVQSHGSEPDFGLWTLDFGPRLGVAADRFVAEVAARRTPAGTWRIVEPGREREFLDPLSVRYLPGSAETHRRLRLFGLRRIGQVAAIPTGDLIRQFGAEGRLLADRSRGIDPRPITPWEPPPEIAERIVFEAPVESLGALRQACDPAVLRLAEQLIGRGQVAQRVRVDLGFEGSIRAFGARLEWRAAAIDLPQPTARPVDLIRAVGRAIGRVLGDLTPPPLGPDVPALRRGEGETDLSPPSLGPDVPAPRKREGEDGSLRLGGIRNGPGGVVGGRPLTLPSPPGRGFFPSRGLDLNRSLLPLPLGEGRERGQSPPLPQRDGRVKVRVPPLPRGEGRVRGPGGGVGSAREVDARWGDGGSGARASRPPGVAAVRVPIGGSDRGEIPAGSAALLAGSVAGSPGRDRSTEPRSEPAGGAGVLACPVVASTSPLATLGALVTPSLPRHPTPDTRHPIPDIRHPSPLIEVRICLSGITAERGVQLSFFRASPAAVRATIADLQARWGPDVIKQAAIVAPRARLAGRRFVWQGIRLDRPEPGSRGGRRSRGRR